MRLKLLRQQRITHEPGDIVEVSPAQARFLLSTRSAVPADLPSIATPEKRETRETRRKKGPEKK